MTDMADIKADMARQHSSLQVAIHNRLGRLKPRPTQGAHNSSRLEALRAFNKVST